MVEVATSTQISIDKDEICKDEQARRDKDAVMKQQSKNALYSSISQVATFVAGILMAAGTGALGKQLPQLFTNLPALLASDASVGVVLIGVAALATLVAVGSNMIAMKTGSSAYFDQSEANAKHNAKYIVKELKQAHSKQFECEHEQNQRSDGQQWAAVMEARQQAAKAAGQTL